MNRRLLRLSVVALAYLVGYGLIAVVCLYILHLFAELAARWTFVFHG